MTTLAELKGKKNKTKDELETIDTYEKIIADLRTWDSYKAIPLESFQGFDLIAIDGMASGMVEAKTKLDLAAQVKRAKKAESSLVKGLTKQFRDTALFDQVVGNLIKIADGENAPSKGQTLFTTEVNGGKDTLYVAFAVRDKKIDPDKVRRKQHTDSAVAEAIRQAVEGAHLADVGHMMSLKRGSKELASMTLLKGEVPTDSSRVYGLSIGIRPKGNTDSE